MITAGSLQSNTKCVKNLNHCQYVEFTFCLCRPPPLTRLSTRILFPGLRDVRVSHCKGAVLGNGRLIFGCLAASRFVRRSLCHPLPLSVDPVLPQERLNRRNFRIFWSTLLTQVDALSLINGAASLETNAGQPCMQEPIKCPISVYPVGRPR